MITIEFLSAFRRMSRREMAMARPSRVGYSVRTRAANSRRRLWAKGFGHADADFPKGKNRAKVSNPARTGDSAWVLGLVASIEL